MDLSKFLPYVDKYVLITQKNLDGGDSANRNSVFLSLTKMAGYEVDYKNVPLSLRYAMTKMMLKVDAGVYVRHPDPTEWYSNPESFTRDQRAMLEIAMALYGDKRELRESMFYILKRGGFHQNVRHGTDDPKNRWKIPDFITPGQITTYIRGLCTSKIGKALSYPILVVLDLGLLVDIGLRGDSHDIDNMLATKMLFDYKVNSTFVSRFAIRKYVTTDFLKKIEENYAEGPEKNGIAPMSELFKEAYTRNGLL